MDRCRRYFYTLKSHDVAHSGGLPCAPGGSNHVPRLPRSTQYCMELVSKAEHIWGRNRSRLRRAHVQLGERDHAELLKQDELDADERRTPRTAAERAAFGAGSATARTAFGCLQTAFPTQSYWVEHKLGRGRGGKKILQLQDSLSDVDEQEELDGERGRPG